MLAKNYGNDSGGLMREGLKSAWRNQVPHNQMIFWIAINNGKMGKSWITVVITIGLDKIKKLVPPIGAGVGLKIMAMAMPGWRDACPASINVR